MKRPIYVDYNATMLVAPEVAQAMAEARQSVVP